MSTTPEAEPASTPEAPSRETRRQEFRKLMMILLGCIALGWGAEFLAPAPERFVEASVAEIETIPEWRYWTGMAAAVVLGVIHLFGIYRLWHYKADGMGYIALAMFFPIFFMLPITLSMSSFAYYVEVVADMVTGMVLYACWSNPDLFERATDADIQPQIAAEATKSTGPATS